MHAHISLRSRFGREFEEALSPSDHLLLQEQQLFLWLAHGLTTIRNLDHDPSLFGRDLRGDEVLKLRARVAAGDVLGPRIYTAGYITGRLSRPDMNVPLQLHEVAEAVRTYKAAGFDFIKSTGEPWSRTSGTSSTA